MKTAGEVPRRNQVLTGPDIPRAARSARRGDGVLLHYSPTDSRYDRACMKGKHDVSHAPLSHQIARDLAGLLRRSRPRKHARLQHRQLRCEPLEDRRLLSGVSFADPALFDAGGQGSYRSVMADFSGDGNLDVAVANGNGGDVSILLGDGQGQFTIPLKYPTGGSRPNVLLALDVNWDNHPDLVVGDVNGTLSTLMNDGHGGFGTPTTYPSGGFGSFAWPQQTSTVTDSRISS